MGGKLEHGGSTVAYSDWSWVLDEVMDKMKAFVYVTDLETDEILFMNRNMREAFGVDGADGKICWQIFQKDPKGRCAFCPVNILTAGDGRDSYIWEEHNELTGRIYENYDSLMRWKDGRLVHFQQSIDVTETRRLYQFASIDELTGILNRRAGKERLRERLAAARSAGRPLILCMFDIDGLKQVNDSYGHSAGDETIRRAVTAVKSSLSPGDVLFRLSGDEFVIVFADASQEQARALIEGVRGDLRTPQSGRAVSFCYGLLEIPSARSITVEEALSAVDERLYDQKRNLHIARAAQTLREGGPSCASTLDYDASLLYDALIRSTDDYVYVTDMESGTFRYPPAMVAEFDLPCEVVENAAAVWGGRVHPDDRKAFLESNQEIADGRTDSHCVEYRAKNRKGEWVWLRCRGHAVRDQPGGNALFAGFITNLGKRNRIDHLTGLMNKFELEEEAARLLSQGAAIALMVFGVDDLKRVNSLYDRATGDEVLRITAQKIQSFLPPNGGVYRMDGDEFGVILRSGTREAAQSLYRELQVLFDRQQSFDGKKFCCTLSCGCAFSGPEAADCQSLLRHVHFALDFAKSLGKNQLQFFSQEVLAHRTRAMELTELLRESVEHGFEGFELYYQPIFTASGESLSGAEALCRWRCEKYGPISPVEFIPLLEESGLIHQAGRWIFRQAVAACARWQRRMPGLMMGVNLSYLQLEDPTFLPFAAGVLEEYRLPPSCLVTELTESHLAANIQAVSEAMVRLRRMDVLVSMDDFGTGYSSLSLLKHHPIDVVKIDRSFVQGARTSAFDSAFLRFISELCRSVGIRVCLEGVETEDELDFVRPFAFDYLQGFFFSRPVPADEFEGRFLPAG